MRSLPDEWDTHSIFVVRCVMRVWTRSSFRRHGEPDRFVRRRAFHLVKERCRLLSDEEPLELAEQRLHDAAVRRASLILNLRLHGH
jgi:hypothetical protein